MNKRKKLTALALAVLMGTQAPATGLYSMAEEAVTEMQTESDVSQHVSEQMSEAAMSAEPETVENAENSETDKERAQSSSEVEEQSAETDPTAGQDERTETEQQAETKEDETQGSAAADGMQQAKQQEEEAAQTEQESEEQRQKEEDAAVDMQESESETAQETELQTEETEEEYFVYVGSGENCHISFPEDTTFIPDQQVVFSVTPEEGYSLAEYHLYSLYPAEGETPIEQWGNALDERTIQGEIRDEQTDLQEDGSMTITFTMPHSDVLIEAMAEDELALLLGTSLAVKLGGDVSRVDYDTPWGTGKTYWFPDELINKPSGQKLGTRIKEFTVYGQNGKVAEKGLLGFCLQSSLGSPEKTTKVNFNKLDSDKEALLAKGLFYLYLGPGFDSSFTGTDGKTYNFKQMFKEAGATNTDGRYSMTHLILSKIYYDFKGKPSGWKWNCGINATGTDYFDILNKKGEDFVKDVVKGLEKLEVPKCELSEATFTKKQMKLQADGSYRTPDIVYTSTKENKLNFTLPEGITMFDVTSGKSRTGGSVSLAGGHTFYLAAKAGMSGRFSFKATPAIFGNTQSYRVKFGGDHQDVGFSYSPSGQAFTMSLEVPESTIGLRVRKLDADHLEQPSRAGLSLAGAVFGVYRDEACTAEVLRITTEEDGWAHTDNSLAIGDYYVKELSAPTGYNVSTQVLHFTKEMEINALSSGSYAEVSVTDEVIRGNLELTKVKSRKDGYEETAEGIKFRLTCLSDPNQHFNVSGEEDILVTDQDGKATTVSAAYPHGTLIYGQWKLEEIEAPEGYRKMEPVTIEINSQGQLVTYKADNQRIYVQLHITKIDGETGHRIPVKGVAFTLTDEAGDTVELQGESKFLTDENGQVQLPDSIPVGTYTIHEDASTLPEGYKPGEDKTVAVTESDQDAAFSVTWEEPVQKGKITILKTDAEDGKAVGGTQFLLRLAEDIQEADGQLRRGTDAEGNTVEYKAGTPIASATTDAEGKAEFTDLYLGTYEIEEIKSASGYAVSPEKIQVTLSWDKDNAVLGEDVAAQLTIKNHPTQLNLVKRSADEKKPLQGTVFTIENMHTGEKESVSTDENGVIRKLYLQPDTDYTVREESSTLGYVNEKYTFTFHVDALGCIDGNYLTEQTVENEPTRVEISKKDITGGEEIPGAKLTLLDEQGKVIESWISEKTPHKVRALVPGTYRLREELAPEGYEKAEEITFKVNETKEVQKVTMYDRRKETEKTTETPKTGSPSDTPKTGDSTPIGLYLLMLLFGAGSGAGIIWRRKKAA